MAEISSVDQALQGPVEPLHMKHEEDPEDFDWNPYFNEIAIANRPRYDELQEKFNQAVAHLSLYLTRRKEQFKISRPMLHVLQMLEWDTATIETFLVEITQGIDKTESTRGEIMAVISERDAANARYNALLGEGSKTESEAIESLKEQLKNTWWDYTMLKEELQFYRKYVSEQWRPPPGYAGPEFSQHGYRLQIEGSLRYMLSFWLRYSVAFEPESFPWHRVEEIAQIIERQEALEDFVHTILAIQEHEDKPTDETQTGLSPEGFLKALKESWINMEETKVQYMNVRSLALKNIFGKEGQPSRTKTLCPPTGFPTKVIHDIKAHFADEAKETVSIVEEKQRALEQDMLQLERKHEIAIHNANRIERERNEIRASFERVQAELNQRVEQDKPDTSQAKALNLDPTMNPEDQNDTSQQRDVDPTVVEESESNEVTRSRNEYIRKLESTVKYLHDKLVKEEFEKDCEAARVALSDRKTSQNRFIQYLKSWKAGLHGKFLSATQNCTSRNTKLKLILNLALFTMTLKILQLCAWLILVQLLSVGGFQPLTKALFNFVYRL